MKSIITIIICLFAYTTMAQESDSVKVEEDAPIIEREEAKRDTVQNAESGTTPKIIYYQTIPEQQKTHRRKDIRTLSGSMNHSGGFGALSFRSTSFRGEAMVLVGLRGGWIINRTLGFGLEAHGVIPTAKYSDIDPMGDVVAFGGYGGMFLELIFFSNQIVHVTFPVSGGAGWLEYSRHFDGNNFQMQGDSDFVDEDVFWYVEPGVGLEVNLSRNFRLAFGASKRFAQDLDLAGTNEGAFDKISYFITIKVGGF